jgi:hypothetical protein
MHPIIRHSLLASIQTIRTVLQGMEMVLKNFEEKEVKEEEKFIEEGITSEDEKRIASLLGLEVK